MAKQQEEVQKLNGEPSYRETDSQQNEIAPVLTLEDSLEVLKSLGSFKFIETTVEGVRDLNPQKKGAKANYLSDEETEQERRDLLKRLEMWADLIGNSQTVDQMQ